MEITRHTFLETKEFKFDYEIVGNILVLHLDVTQFSHSVLKLMRSVFDLFKEDARSQGYEALATFTPNPKFVSLFGGEVVDHLIIENKYIEVFKWELKQP